MAANSESAQKTARHLHEYGERRGSQERPVDFEWTPDTAFVDLSQGGTIEPSTGKKRKQGGRR